MNISEIGISGFKSFGNNEQVLKLNTEKGELILLCGKNGNGKCVDESTIININIDDININSKSIDFLVKTELGRRILLYIKENNSQLYERISNRINK